MTVQDELSTYLISLGWSGTNDDMYRDQLVSVTGGEGCTQDLLRSFLSSKGFTGGISTALNQYLKSLGYSGSSNDMLLSSYENRDFFEVVIRPTITVQPQNQDVDTPSVGTFSVTATVSSGTMTYQWQVNEGVSWVDIPGATTSTYTTPASTGTMDGYKYRVVITAVESSEVVTSNTATLNVTVVVPVGDHLSFEPNGYGSQPNLRRVDPTSTSMVIEVVMRLPSTEAVNVIATTAASSLLVSRTSIISYSSFEPTKSISISVALNGTDYYRIRNVRNVSATGTLEVFTEAGVLLYSGSGGQGIVDFNYTNRAGSAGYASADVKRLSIGTVAAPNQHLWNTEPVAGIWQDTGTVGGWDFTLAGTPLPTWE